MWEIFAFEFQYSGLRDRESASRNLESRKLLKSLIQVPVTRIRNPVPGIRNPQRDFRNPRLSWITLHEGPNVVVALTADGLFSPILTVDGY